MPAGSPPGPSSATAHAHEIPGEGAIALSARGITKVFDGKPANDDVDFTVRCGEIHALLGENGAGKTTLISVLCGQYRPDAGSVEVAGEPRRFSSPRDALRAGVGVVHQDLRQVGRFSVVENVVLGTRDRVTRAAEQRVAEISRDLGFHLDPRAIVSGLTVGERQQLEIVKLLYRGMSILILDEPTAVLAPQQSDQLFRALRQLASAGKAVVFITHRLPEVIAAADVVTVLRHGRVVAHRPVAGARPDDLASLMVGDDAGEAVVAAPGSAGDPVLELQDAACGSGRRALNGLSLTVRRGEIVGVAGVSGNGQVELAEVAAGMLAPSRGTRAVHGEVVAFIPEDRLATGLVGGMSIGENLAFRRFGRAPMSRRGWLHRGRIREYAHQLMERFRIPASDHRLQVAKLSGGGLQRVIVAREITESPDLLVAAQPTRGLDIVSADAVRAQIVEARERGAGVLLVSEDLDELMALADRVLVMLGGRAVAEFGRGQATRAEIGRSMTGARREEQPAP
ncbi:MAG TPA: ABC transporter ATP-binding protein [Solirubrobacteraceae bacterium]|nr:ABC transporter ATP-binding protein [Solirubrobacteraceae bacterium]